MKSIAIFVLIICTTARADLTLGIGAGQGIFGPPGNPFERVAQVGYQYNFAQDFFVHPEVVYFEDLSGGGHLSSLIVTSRFGVRTLLPGNLAEVHIALGPAWLQNPDVILGGPFQFSLEGGLCSNDGKEAICALFDHYSSAGIEQPNHGRDFIMIAWRILTL